MTTTAITSEDFFKRLEEDRFGDIQISVDFEVTIDDSVISWHHRIINDVVFKDKVVIRDCEINSGIKFINCKFEQGIVFHNVKSTNYNSTYNPNNESVCFENSEAGFIVFESECFFKRSILIKNTFVLTKLSVNKLVIGNGGFRIKDSEINYLDISNVNFDLSFSHISKATFSSFAT